MAAIFEWSEHHRRKELKIDQLPVALTLHTPLSAEVFKVRDR